MADAHAKPHHDYHLVDPSPWPIVGSISAFLLAVGGITWMRHMFAVAPFIFALGVIGTGFLAIPVLAGSLSYMLAESFGWQQGLDKKFHEAKGFYLAIIVSLTVGLLINFSGISVMKALLYTAILYGITSPVMIAVVLHICNNKKIMNNYTNSRLSNILGTITFLLMTISAITLIYFQFR